MGQLLDQSSLPVMPVFSEDDSPSSTTHNSFAEPVAKVRVKKPANQSTPSRTERQNLPNTPQKLFSNNLKSYNQVKKEDSPFDSRACVIPANDDASRFMRQHNLRGGECDRLAGNLYRSKVFYIRYSDENVRINEVIAFKTELETFFTLERAEESSKLQTSQRQPPKFFLEIDLYFKEATPQEIANQQNITMRIDDDTLRKFVKVAVKRFALAKLQKGAFTHFYPVQFTGGYFSCLQLLVHSATIHFRYREASLFAQVFNAHMLDLKRAQKRESPLMLKAPLRTESDLIIEAINAAKPVLAGYVLRKNLMGGLTEFLFAVVNNQRVVSRKEVRQLQRLFVGRLVEIQDALKSVLQSYLVEMRPGTKGQIQVGDIELEEPEDLLTMLVEGGDKKETITPREVTVKDGVSGKQTVNRTQDAQYMSGSETSSDSLRVQSPSMSPKRIQHSLIAHRDRKKQAPIQPPTRLLNIAKMQLNLTQLQQKVRDKSTPPRNSLSRSPLAAENRSNAQPSKLNNQSSATTLMSYSNDVPNQRAFNTNHITDRKISTKSNIDSSPLFAKTKEVNRTALASPNNRQLMVKNALAAHQNAVNALMKSPQSSSQALFVDKRKSREQKSPARHVKLKLSKQNAQASKAYDKAKTPQTVLLIGNRQPDTAREKHMQLSQMLSHRQIDQRMISTNDQRKQPQQVTKAAVPSIKPQIEKVMSDDLLSLTSDDSLPQMTFTRREKPVSEMLQFQEAKNLSSIELRNQHIVKEQPHEEWQRVEMPDSIPHTNAVKTKQSLNQRGNFTLPHEVGYKTINSLNGQFNRAREYEESKNFIVRSRGHDNQYKSAVEGRGRLFSYNQEEDVDEESNCTDENLNEQHRQNFAEMQSRPTAIKATPGLEGARKTKREDVSPHLKSNNHWEENYDRQTPAIFSKHSVLSSQRSDLQISSFLDTSIVSNLTKPDAQKRKLEFKRNLDIDRLQIVTDSFFNETDDTFVKEHFTKKSNKEIASIQLHGVSKKNHQAAPIPISVKPLSPSPQQFDAYRTCILLERQLTKCATQIHQVWQKLTRAVFLDSATCEKVLQRQYIIQARKFYSQTIVEVYSNIRSANDENLNGLEIDNENVIVRQSIKDSGLSMMLHKHYLNQMKAETQKREMHPFEEAKSQHLKQMVRLKMAPQATQHDRFSFGIQPADYTKFQHPPETERQRFVGDTKSQLFQVSEERTRSISIPKPRENVALGAKPLSPKQIEKSNAIAKDRRRDCSQVREIEDTELTVGSSQSDEPVKIDFAQRMRSRSQLPMQRQPNKQLQTMQTTVDAQELGKVTMPIQELDDKESQQTKQFEPIIMEEVYFNEQEIESLRITKNASISQVETQRNADRTPRNKSPHLSYLQLSAIAKEDFNAISTQRPAAAIRNESAHIYNAQGRATPQEPKRFGPLMKPGLRNQHQQQITETEVDRYSDTVSNFNVTSTVSQADKLRREKFSQANLLEHQSVYLHLFVFVHGFQATAADMRCFRNHLQTVLPNAIFLVSQSNERDTDSRIEELGQRLANEVQEFIFTNLCGARRPSSGKKMFLNKLSFVGHSLGGIIVREALKHLGGFRAKMHAYISLGSPHLGYMYNSSSLVDAGMWLIKKWKKSDSLKQLSMTDTSSKEDSFLFKLSQDDSLKHFKYVMLVSSFQDNYAPHDSARVQMCKKAAEADASRGRVYSRMVENILSSLQCKKLFRLDVNFKIENTNFASFIGRTAHILLIECEPFFLSLIYKYSEVFCE